ncbi:hypothetical protein [Varibaculum cambriense]|uniref:Cell division protein FtsQ n=1 Tax=Varibaculum cambriense TaxID=184870 RepID=A0ABX4URI3_9ACTO|nr:hypothetical protein [Varibaculum cambriense]PMB88805.1 hypothetical protein CJ240_08965 [Varibaculum cambriense]
MSTQLSFNLEELAQKRVVGLGSYQLSKLSAAKPKRPQLQLVDATYIERARAKSRHPAGSKMPCPPAIGRESRTEGAATAFDSLPQWARRAPRTKKVDSMPLVVVPPAAKAESQASARRSAPQRKSTRNLQVPRISHKLFQVSLGLLVMAAALIAGVGFGSYWDATANDSKGISQFSNEVAVENSQASSADLLLGQ